MERMFKRFLSLALLVSVSSALADDCCNTSCNTSCDNDCNNVWTSAATCYLPRSQSRDIVMKDAGLDPDHEHLFDMDSIYGTINLAVEYTQSFSNDKIAQCLFGPAIFNGSISSTANGCCPSDCDSSVSIRVVGTTASTPPNGTTDLIANEFFLPSNFASVITFSPKISNINVPLQLYLGLDEWCSGMYFRVYGYITNTRWKLEAVESPITEGSSTYAAGFVSPVAVPFGSLYTGFLNYTAGNTISLPASTPSVTVNPLLHQRIFSGCNTQSKTGFADLRAELGWDFLLDECYHLGVNIQMAAPTGNKCSDCMLFGPIIGNGHHWELGGGVSGHYTFWRSEDDEQQFDLFVDADITHLFKTSENRSFDLKGKPLSRYMYLANMTTPQSGLTVGGTTTAASLQFNNSYTPLANLTQKVDVSFDVQGDVLAKFVYTCRGFSWELGYNFWGRSCEKVDLDCDCSDQFSNGTWALGTGCIPWYGFNSTTATIPLPVSANGTTVFACGAVNNPTTVAISGTTLTTTAAGGIDSTGSNPVVTVAQSDLDIGKGPRGLSNKVFTHFNYTWIDCEDWIPYLGIGGFAEFGSTKPRGNNSLSSTTTNSCNDDCNNCPNCALSQWGVWVKGGVSFN
jgi:hypothetical protein